MHTVGHILEMALSRSANGYESISHNYFKLFGQTRIARSSLSESREKLNWRAFEYLLNEVNRSTSLKRWKSHRVFAADGTCLNLPHSKEIIESFPLDSDPRRRAHYPKGLLLTVVDVLSGVPLNARLGHYRTDSERELLGDLLPEVPKGSVVLLDRGFDGVRFFESFAKEKLFFIARVRSRLHAHCALPVQNFLKSGRRDAVVEFTNEKGISMRLRLLRCGMDAEGVAIVLASNLLDQKRYSSLEIFECYKKRWRVETFYLRIKRLAMIEHFHSRTVNGIRQEIWATLFVLGITAWLIARVIRKGRFKIEKRQPNFKYAFDLIRGWLNEIVRCRSRNKRKLLDLIYDQITSSVCFKQPGRKNPRIARYPQTSWRRPDGKNRGRVQAQKIRAQMRS